MDTSGDHKEDYNAPWMMDNHRQYSTRTTYLQHQLLYVVQKCWHSGPKQHAPVDMLRLFHSQREAEQGAYHSAVAFHKVHSIPNSSGDSVKTLLLPSYPAHNPQGSSYGFFACGALFWVRALRMTIVVAANNTNTNTNTNSATTTSTTNNNNNNNNNPSVCHSAAYAILTEGVIGGTGNRNSRRGTEISDGRVFGGDATARAMAMEAVARVRDNTNPNTNNSNSNSNYPSLTVETKTVPVGKPADWLSTGALVGDWPAHAELWTSNSSSSSSEAVPFGTTPKRQMGFEQGYNNNNNNWGTSVSMIDEDISSSNNSSCNGSMALIGSNSRSNSNEDFLVVDCPFEEPMAKRRRIVSVMDEYGDHPMMMQ